MSLRKAGWLFEIVVNEKLFSLANIIKKQYFIRLRESPKLAIDNRVTTPTIKTLHACMRDLGYRSLQKLQKLAKKINVKGSAPMKVCSGCIKDCLPKKSSCIQMIRAIEFLEEIKSDLGGPLLPTHWREQYYIFFQDDAIGTYHIKTIRDKSLDFQKILKFHL